MTSGERWEQDENRDGRRTRRATASTSRRLAAGLARRSVAFSIYHATAAERRRIGEKVSASFPPC